MVTGQIVDWTTSSVLCEEFLRTPRRGPHDIVRCNDTPYSGDLQGSLRRADADAKKYPFIGYQNTVTSCAFWPYRQNARTVDLTGVPRMLMFQSEGPLVRGRRVALGDRKSVV